MQGSGVAEGGEGAGHPANALVGHARGDVLDQLAAPGSDPLDQLPTGGGDVEEHLAASPALGRPNEVAAHDGSGTARPDVRGGMGAQLRPRAAFGKALSVALAAQSPFASAWSRT